MELLNKRRMSFWLMLTLIDVSGQALAAPAPIVSSATARVVRVRYQPVGACKGVDDTITPVAIMAPVGASNDARVSIAPPSQASRVQFSSADTTKATVSPAASGSPLAIQVSGVARGDTLIRAQTSTSGILRTMTASPKPPLTRTVAIHAVTESNDDVQVEPVGQGEANQTCITAGTNGVIDTTPAGDDGLVGTSLIHSGSNGICNTAKAGDDVQVIPLGQGRPNRPCVSQGANAFRDSVPSGDDQVSGADIDSGANGMCQTTARSANLVPANVPTASALETYLNSVWEKQANIHFTVTRTDPSAPINWDLNRDAILADPTVTLDEINAIAAGARTAGVNYNIYFINVMQIPHAFTLQVTGIPVLLQNSTWIQSTHANSEENVSAHEVGHLLGINYESTDLRDVMLEFGSSTNPCEVRKIDWDTVNRP